VFGRGGGQVGASSRATQKAGAYMIKVPGIRRGYMPGICTGAGSPPRRQAGRAMAGTRVVLRQGWEQRVMVGFSSLPPLRRLAHAQPHALPFLLPGRVFILQL